MGPFLLREGRIHPCSDLSPTLAGPLTSWVMGRALLRSSSDRSPSISMSKPTLR